MVGCYNGTTMRVLLAPAGVEARGMLGILVHRSAPSPAPSSTQPTSHFYIQALLVCMWVSVCEQRHSWEFIHVSTGAHGGQRCWICWELNLGSLRERHTHLPIPVHSRRAVTDVHSTKLFPWRKHALPVHEHKVEGLSCHPADLVSNAL